MALNKELSHGELLTLKHNREDANRAVGFALWSYLGLALPLIGWILAGYSLSLTRDLPLDGIIGRRVKTAHFHARLSIVLSVIILIVWVNFYFSLLNEARRIADEDRQAEISQQKAAEEKAHQQQTLKQARLNSCLSAADKGYWDYIKLNATSTTEAADGPVYRAYQNTWDTAENTRKNAKDDCFRQASFQ